MNTAIWGIFAKRAAAAGINIASYSAYSLRHAFAMRLLERGGRQGDRRCVGSSKPGKYMRLSASGHQRFASSGARDTAVCAVGRRPCVTIDDSFAGIER
jgi:hypothetical protein